MFAVLKKTSAIILVTLLLYALPKITFLFKRHYAMQLIDQVIYAEAQKAYIDNYEWNVLSSKASQQKLTEAINILDQLEVTDTVSLRKKALAMALLGRIESSISILSEVVRIQPESPLAWLELGTAYYVLDSSNANSDSDPVEIIIPKHEQKHYQWFLPVRDSLHSEWWSPSRVVGLSAYTSQEIILPISVPENPSSLIVWFAAVEQIQQPIVSYQIFVGERELINRQVFADEMNKWNPVVLDLSGESGQDITITLIANAIGAEFAWSSATIVDNQDLPCRVLNCRLRALAAWERGGYHTNHFLTSLEIAEKTQQYKAAEHWKKKLAYMTSEVVDRMPQLLAHQDLAIMESFASSEGIQICPWCGKDTGRAHFEVSKGILSLASETSIYMGELNYTVSYFSNIVIKLRSKRGNSLATIELYIDNDDFKRYFVEVKEEWFYWNIPIDGHNLYMIILAAHGSKEDTELEVDWIGIR